MTTVYVDVPVGTATIGGMDCYCCNCRDDDGCYDPNLPSCNSGGHCTQCGSQSEHKRACLHNTARLASPIDIVCGGDLAVYCDVSSSIQSIRTTKVESFCATAPPEQYSWVNHGVEVELFTGQNASGTMVGQVFYGHLKETRISNGVHNRDQTWILGYSGSGNCCPCYMGGHIHVERSTDRSGSTYYRSCGDSVYSFCYVYTFTY